MRYYLDTEFIDLPPRIYPLSIGIVAEDGREYYAEYAETDQQLACPWVRQHVLPQLTGPVKTRFEIQEDLIQFVGDDVPAFWGWFPAYDWVVLCQTFGRMVDGLPPHWPNRPNDLVQKMIQTGVRRGAIPQEPEGRHHALADARWCKVVDDFLEFVRERVKEED